MKKYIPAITFKAGIREDIDFEIISIKKLAQQKHHYNHDPELPHRIKFYNLIFFTKGKGKHFIDFQWYPVQKNSFVFITKEQINAFDFSGTLKGFCIIFSEEYFVKSFSNLPKDFVFRAFNPQIFPPVLTISENSNFKKYFRLLRKEYKKIHAFNQKTIIESLFIILVSKAESLKQNQSLSLQNSSKINVLQQFHFLLEMHFKKTRNAQFYAKELNISYKHLNSICKEATHRTAKENITNFIILQAKRALINSSIKSTELAYNLGFEDPTNFIKYFKKNTGLTPNSFKKSLLK